MICTGSSDSSKKSAPRVRWPGTPRVHCFAQPVGIKSAGHAEIKLQRVQITMIGVRADVEQQPLLKGGERQDIRDVVALIQLIELLLAEVGGRDVGSRLAGALVGQAGFVGSDAC